MNLNCWKYYVFCFCDMRLCKLFLSVFWTFFVYPVTHYQSMHHWAFAISGCYRSLKPSSVSILCLNKQTCFKWCKKQQSTCFNELVAPDGWSLTSSDNWLILWPILAYHRYVSISIYQLMSNNTFLYTNTKEVFAPNAVCPPQSFDRFVFSRASSVALLHFAHSWSP